MSVYESCGSHFVVSTALSLLVQLTPGPPLELPDPPEELDPPSFPGDASDGSTPELLPLDPDDEPEPEELPDPAPSVEEASSPWAGLPVLPPHAPGTAIAAAMREERSDR